MNISRSGDETSRKQDSVWDLFDGVFTSVRMAIFLLFALAVASVLGTVIPQEITLHQLSRAQESLYGRLALILDLHQVYRSWWFLLLLVLLCLNLIGCLRKRIPAIYHDWNGKRFRETFILSFIDGRPVDEVKRPLSEAIGRVIKTSPTYDRKDNEIYLDWIRHRIYLVGFPLIHLAIIVILVGALGGLLFGFKGTVQIREGSAGDRYTLMPSGQIATLPFEIALDKFELSRYPSGEPKEYRSEVRLLKNGNEVYKGSIRVNHPLTHQRISLFQSDYKLVGVRGVTVTLEGPDGFNSEIVLVPGEATRLPQQEYRVRLVALDPGASIRGPWIDVSVEKENEEPQNIRIFQKDSKPVRVGDYELQLKGYEPLYSSGLQIGYDPGAYLVWAGCIMLMAGFVLTLFTNYRRIRVRMVPDGMNKTSLRISGCSRRMRREFRDAVEQAIKDNIKVV